jgi:hypothetical protein
MRLDRYTKIDGVMLGELIELAASQHRVANPTSPPTGADMERRKRFH